MRKPGFAGRKLSFDLELGTEEIDPLGRALPLDMGEFVLHGLQGIAFRACGRGALGIGLVDGWKLILVGIYLWMRTLEFSAINHLTAHPTHGSGHCAGGTFSPRRG